MTIAVIGAGASGMMAALTAAEQPENKILLFERQARVGRKLAVTGNGRCNLTNTGAAPENYHGAQPDFAAPALAAFPPEAALRWFAAHGLMTVTEPGGRVYPLSNAANSVVDVLRFALARPNIALRAGEAVTAVRRQERGFVIETESERIPAHLVIIACGGAAGAKGSGRAFLRVRPPLENGAPCKARVNRPAPPARPAGGLQTLYKHDTFPWFYGGGRNCKIRVSQRERKDLRTRQRSKKR